jgi:hypothetical protein
MLSTPSPLQSCIHECKYTPASTSLHELCRNTQQTLPSIICQLHVMWVHLLQSAL